MIRRKRTLRVKHRPADAFCGKKTLRFTQKRTPHSLSLKAGRNAELVDIVIPFLFATV